MDVGEGQIHPVALDGAGNPTDKHYCAVVFLALHNTDMSQRVVGHAVPIVIPGVVKKDEVTGPDGRTLMKFAVPVDMTMDQLHTVGFWIRHGAVVEVDPVLKKNCSGHAGAVVGNASALDVNRARPDKPDRRLDDGSAPGRSLGGLTAGLTGEGSRGAVTGRRGAADERHDCDEKSNQDHSGQRDRGRVHSCQPSMRATIGQAIGQNSILLAGSTRGIVVVRDQGSEKVVHSENQWWPTAGRD